MGRRSRAVASTSVVQVFDVDCHARRSPGEPEEYTTTSQIVLPRRGVFGVTREGRRDVAEPSVAVLLESGSTYSVDHPSDHGDRCTVLLFDGDVLDDAFAGSPATYIRLAPRTQLAGWLMTHGTGWDALERESFGLDLIDMLAADAGRRCEVVLGRAQRRRVDEVVSLLAARPTDAWTVSSLADAVHVSRFHLARQFRQATGMTLAQYLLRLRLALVLDRLGDAGHSLARLATDAGFSHHSHLSQRFRSVFGMTPTMARRSLTSGRLEAMRQVAAPSAGRRRART